MNITRFRCFHKRFLLVLCVQKPISGQNSCSVCSSSIPFDKENINVLSHGTGTGEFCKVLYSNVDMFSNKKDELLLLVSKLHPDVICLSELINKFDSKKPRKSPSTL